MQDGIVMSESQLADLEKAKNKREANGEIESQHPGYLGLQDTYYVGNIKGDRTYNIRKLLLILILELLSANYTTKKQQLHLQILSTIEFFLFLINIILLCLECLLTVVQNTVACLLA